MREKINLPILSPILLAKTATDNQYSAPAHVRLMESEILSGLASGSSRIIVNMPPRHGKSEFISKFLPAWYLMNFPDRRVILTSYESTFAMSWSRKVRELIATLGEKAAGISLDKSNNTQSEFSIAGHSGGMQALGALGAITGKGADLIIIDDPVKNDADANSETIRENTWEWFRSTVFTRLEPGGSIIIAMTRWHEDDLTGKIMSDPAIAKDWRQIVLPALAGENCLLGRRPGEPLWSARYSGEALGEIRKAVGSYWFDALYNQVPGSPAGGIFRRSDFRYYTRECEKYVTPEEIFASRDITLYATVDLAIATSQTSDFTVVMVFGVAPGGRIFIVDIIRERLDSLRHREMIIDIYRRYNPRLIGIESVQYQNSLVRALAAEGLPVKALKPTADKVSRALPMQAKLENGLVYFPKYAAWLDDFERELAAFPNAGHDDQADCFAYINNMTLPASAFLPISARRKIN